MFQVRDIPVDQILLGDFQQRFDLLPNSLDDLCGSIRRLGILVPLLVRGTGDGLVLVAGHRRLAAAKRVGLATVPCVLREDTELQSMEASYAENLFRLDPTAVELAVSIKKAVSSGEVQLTEIADGLGRTPDWVRRQLAMLDWPEDVLQHIHAGNISVAAGANLALVRDDAYRAFLLECAVSNGATARTTAAWLQAWEASMPMARAVEQPPVDAGQRAQPMVPQAPCLCCSNVFRTDELSHVPLCAPCILKVRHLGGGS